MSFFRKGKVMKHNNDVLWSDKLDIDNPTKLKRRPSNARINIEELRRENELKVYLRSSYLL